MPVTIKRYSNRKLYDTERKSYISLEEVARLIRCGEEVSIVDNDSGEDLTALTLTQILMDQERKQSGFLPGALLAGLVQAGGEPFERLRRSLSRPLGLAGLVEEELKRRIDLLVEQKDLKRAEGTRLLAKLLQVGQEEREGTFIETAVQKVLEEQGIPSRQDLLELLVQVEELTEKVDELGQK